MDFKKLYFFYQIDFIVSKTVSNYGTNTGFLNNNLNSIEIAWDTDFNCVYTFTTWNTDHYCVYIHWNISQMFTNKKKKVFL